MPWCPKCGNEYKDGVTECTECHIPLVNEFPKKLNYTLLVTLEKIDYAKKLVAYLEYNKIDSFYEENKNGEYDVSVPKKSFHKAEDAFRGFYLATKQLEEVDDIKKRLKENGLDADKLTEKDTSLKEHDKEKDDFDDDDMDAEDTDDEDEKIDTAEKLVKKVAESVDDKETQKKVADVVEEVIEEENNDMAFDPYAASGAYQRKADRKKDYESTAVTFIGFGIVGIIVVTLQLLKVINFFSSLSTVILAVMFVAFIIVGIDAQIRAKKISKDAKAENEFEAALRDFLNSSLTEDVLKSFDSGENEEADYLDEIVGIKKMITDKYGDIDHGFLDQFTEDYYNDRFES